MGLRIADRITTFPDSQHHFCLQEGRKELPESLTYECTTDMQYLRQYFFIREYAYRTDLKLEHFSGQEDAVDKYSHLLVIRKGHYCIGGARLTISTPNKRLPLPLESDQFRVRDILPEIAGGRYCELGRLAILPEYRHQGGLERLFQLAATIATDMGCTYMMGVSPPVVARRFAAAYRQLGFEAAVRKDIATPVKAIHEHLRLQFILVNLANRKG